jgi:hypothetical protein
MSKNQERVMTAKQFAEQMKVNYRTALNWLEAQLVPGAERKPSPVGEYWEIPQAALKMERPRPGPKPNKAATQSASGSNAALTAGRAKKQGKK